MARGLAAKEVSGKAIARTANAELPTTKTEEAQGSASSTALHQPDGRTAEKKVLHDPTAAPGHMHEGEDHGWEHRGRAAAGRGGDTGKLKDAEEEEEEPEGDEMDADEA